MGKQAGKHGKGGKKGKKHRKAKRAADASSVPSPREAATALESGVAVTPADRPACPPVAGHWFAGPTPWRAERCTAERCTADLATLMLECEVVMASEVERFLRTATDEELLRCRREIANFYASAIRVGLSP